MSRTLGQILHGRRFSYQLIQALKGTSVFKAKVLPGSQALQSSTGLPNYAAIKTPPTAEMMVPFDRERRNYELPEIAASPDIRSLIDIVDSKTNAESKSLASQPPCMVFEWMDTDIWNLRSEQHRSSKLPKIIAKSLLRALVTIKEKGATHTDVNPNNVFVSAVETASPVSKLGDLGTMVIDGYDKIRLQGLHCRAPEVWGGAGCSHASDVWSVGVTLAHWLANRVIFGHADKIVENMTDAWCIAKIARLVGPVGQPRNPEYNDDFALAEYFAGETFTHPETGVVQKYIKVGTIREELEKLPGPPVDSTCIDFIEHLLVIDHSKRPTASEALGHYWLADMIDHV